MEQEPVQGEELQSKRVALGLSREDVFRKLRISLEFIHNIESGQLKQCPTNTYTVGFIKSYCDLLNTNPQPYIAELMMEHQVPKSILKQTKERLSKESPDQPLWLREAVMWAGVFGIIALGWVTYSLVFQPSTEKDTQQVSADSIDMRVPKFPMR
jgi:cytoskeleton protein RodZ